ncbi:MAG: succinate dehydrogenase iron-sulfur subunit [Candidatus Eisenbacteria bacterium]|nr:succinate dehydrogenase iron-sulfur subunit [Candidatus Eisenbacteria bacterium]
MIGRMVRMRVRRQDGPDQSSRWEDFEVPYRQGMNVITCLQDIQKKPVTRDGKTVPPVAWECSCLEEVCGSCTMVINGKPRQSCSALVDQLTEPIRLEPMSKFPLIRDLIVDRSRMFEALKRVRAWVPIDGTHDLGPGPRFSPEKQQVYYQLQRCMTCGCCLEVCPQVTTGNNFIGAAAISQVRIFNAHPTGAMHASERIDALTEEGGIQDCGNAQNCVEACPKEIDLVESIADMNRQATRRIIQKMFGG